MTRPLPNSLTLAFSRMAQMPLQLVRQAVPPRRRRPRRKRRYFKA